jgi:hypothetical protein
MKFASHFPAQCPPPEAESASGTVFRLVKSDPPTVDDFLSHAELGLARTGPACKRCGLSVFRVRDDGIHMHNLYPNIGSYLAEGELQATHGQTQLTKGALPTHTTWWVCVGIDRAKPFVKVEKIG